MKKILLLFAAFSLATGAFSQHIPEKVDPPFWWTGMKNSQLQLMVYGDGIGLLNPVIRDDRVHLLRSVKVENPNYLFLYLDLEDTEAGSFEIRFLDDQEQEVYTALYELLHRRRSADQVKGYDNSDVVYLITPDRFANGNPGNDDLKEMLETSNRADKWGRHGGDIQGISERLDYISNLGFTAIWLNPVLENNQPSSSYHGYSTTDFYRVDPRFGTNEEYRELSASAGEKGLKVIMDMIANHCGSGHWWMEDLPSQDWVNQPEDPFFTNHRRTTLRDPYASVYDTKHFVDGWFVSTMPDLNQRNPLLADYLIQNAIWWIEYASLSGIRMDTYPYSVKEFMSKWTCAIMEEYPEFNIVGEEWSLNPAVLAYWQKGKINPDGYVSCLPGLLDFPLQHALVNGLMEEENWNTGMVNLYVMLSNDFLYADPFRHVIFPDNHDMSRIFSQLNEDFDLWKLAMVYFATMRGTPQFYYGTEILMSNTGDDSHGNIRSDFPGGWPDDPVNGFTGTGLTANQKEAQQFLGMLLNWRKGSEVIHHGKLIHYAPSNGVYTYFRHMDGKRIMVVLNKSNILQPMAIEPLEEMVAPGEKGTNILTGERMTFTDTLTITGKSAMIIEIDPSP